MERILTDGASVRESFGEMILQPQSDIPHFRRFIRAQGWEIRQEDMVLEDGKFYPMMRVTKAESIPPYSREEEAFGKLLLDRRHPVLKEYLLRELRIRNDIAGKLEQAPKPSAVAERLQEVKEEQQLILAALKKYESL